jgi:hypothetical protein
LGGEVNQQSSPGHQAQLLLQVIQQAAQGLLLVVEVLVLVQLLNNAYAGHLSFMSALWMLSLSWVDLIVSVFSLLQNAEISLSRQIQPSYVCLVKGAFFHQCYAFFLGAKMSVSLSVCPNWQEQPQKVCCG